MLGGWITIADLAPFWGRSESALEKGCRRISAGRAATYRDCALIVRRARGRGGSAGFHYEVLIESLPLGIQQALKAQPTAEQLAFAFRHDGEAKRDWMSRLLAPAAACPKGSGARSAAIDAILNRRITDWTGAPFITSRRNIQRKLAACERDGAGALAPRMRADKGIKRVAIAKAWDRRMRAAGTGALAIQEIAVELQSYIRGLYKKNTSPKIIGTLAAARLRELTVLAEVGGAGSWPGAAFAVPRRFIEAESAHRNVAIFKKDRKAFEDAKPRILRTRDGLVPMQIVVGDVHHLDICMRRPDGSITWPKAIAWLDLATNRVWLTIVLLAPGEGIRNADVIASFIEMCTAWGMPQTLYLDNGSEYRWSDFINDALKLIARVECGDDRDSRIVRAKPYNAPAKVIEGIFGVLEYTYFRTLPGWAGGDRTNKKTEKVGRPTEPFPGGIDELRAAIASHLTLYEISPQRGALKGRSPRQAYEAAIAAGWQRIAIDPRELYVAFATDELRIPRQGYISFAGDKWTCPELQSYLGERIIVRAPKFDSPAVLPLLDAKTRDVNGFAQRARRFDMLDPAGAREAATMDRRRRAAIRELDRAAPDIDPNAEIARLTGNVPPAIEAPIAGTIGISPEAAEIARGLAEPPAEREARRKQASATRNRKATEIYGSQIRDRSIFK